MPRPPRVFKDSGVYHLIARGNNRKAIFETANGYMKFKEILFLSRLKFDWQIYHYCLMPNHVHLMACIEKSDDLPRIMHFILLAYSRWYRGKNDYVGYLWQGRYKSPVIDDEKYFLECGRYIERNPQRAKLGSIEEYPWSSYRHYAMGKNDALVYPNPEYQNFGTSVEERQKNYRDFVRLDSMHEPLIEKVLLSNFF